MRFVFPIGHANEEEQEIDEPDEPSSVNNEDEAHVESEASKVLSLPQYVSEEFEISVAIQRRAKAYRALLKEADACRELKQKCVILNAIRRYVTCYSTFPIGFVKYRLNPYNIVTYQTAHNYIFKYNYTLYNVIGFCKMFSTSYILLSVFNNYSHIFIEISL